MKITIGLDDLDILVPNTTGQIIRLFQKKVHKYLVMYEATEIVTNVHIATVLQDSGEFTTYPISSSLSLTNNKPDPYLIGNIYMTKAYVDPMMTWTDDRIIVKGSDIRLRREKILKMRGEKEFEDFLEEIIVDGKLGSMLL